MTLPFRGAALDAASVTIDGRPVASATVTDGQLTACMSAGFPMSSVLQLDADLTIALSTLAPSQVGYSTEQDSDKNPYYYLVSWVGGCDQFAPCDSRPDQFATYHFAITHKPGITVRCPGTIDETDPAVTSCDFDHPGGPTYSTFGVIASSAWTQTDKGSWGGVHVTVYDRTKTGIAAAIDSTYHDGFITWMQSQFGPYPYGGELRVLTAPTYWNGFEHPGNIVLADTLKHQFMPPYSDNVAHTLDHEMTHMWAGDQTTISTTYDFAWKESMAEYLPYVYESTTSAAVGDKTAAAWKVFASSAVHPPVPDDSPALIDFYSDVYGAGPMILFRQVEAMYSRDAVLAALRTLLGHPHAMTVDDVVAALSTATGEDLTAYAHAWLHGTGTPEWPRFQLTFVQASAAGSGSATTSTLDVHQVNQDKGVRGCTFHVALVSADGTQVTKVAVDTLHGGADQTISVPTPAFTVMTTSLDPDHECLVYPPVANLEAVKIAPTRPWVAPRSP